MSEYERLLDLLERIAVAVERFAEPVVPTPMIDVPRRKKGPPAGSPSRIEAGIKRGAQMLGIPVEEYRRRREAGECWCYGHRAWEPASDFGPCATNPNGRARRCRTATTEARERLLAGKAS